MPGVDRRARLTIADLALLLFSVAALGALAPVFLDSLSANVGTLDTGTVYLFRMLLPLTVIVLLFVIWRTAVGGGY